MTSVTVVDTTIRSGAPRAAVQYVLEELLACLDLGNCPRLRLTYRDAPADPADAVPGTPWVHIRAGAHFGGGAAAFDSVVHDGTPTPVIARTSESAIEGGAAITITFDLIASAFHFLSGGDVFGGRGRVGRPGYSGSMLASLRPPVPPANALVSVLAQAIRDAGARVDSRRKPTLCLTSEVRGLASPDERAWKREMGVAETLFVTPERVKVGPAPDDRVEFGLGATSASSLDEQGAELAAHTGLRPRGVRLPDLRPGIDALLYAIDAAGFEYDSSLAYPDAADFPTGFTFPHRLFSVERARPSRFVELPLFAAVGPLRRHLRASAAELHAAVIDGGSVVAKSGGTLAVSWGEIRDVRDHEHREARRASIGALVESGFSSMSMSEAIDTRRAAYDALRIEVRT